MEKKAAEYAGELAALEGWSRTWVRWLDCSLSAPRRNRTSTCSSS